MKGKVRLGEIRRGKERKGKVGQICPEKGQI